MLLARWPPDYHGAPLEGWATDVGSGQEFSVVPARQGKQHGVVVATGPGAGPRRSERMPRLSSAVMLVLVLTVVTPLGAQTPAPDPLVQAANTPPQFGAAVVIAPPGGLCRELVTQFATASGPRGDLRDRCRELVADAKIPALTGPVQTGLEQM